MPTPEAKRSAQRAANRRFYERHRETEKERTKLWRLNNPEKLKSWVEKNKERIRGNSRRYEYNMLPEQYEALLQKQEGKCAICKTEMAKPVVDHNHACCPQRGTCGQCNRGLLCQKCNTVIGLAQDSIALLSNAIQYLKEYHQ